MKKAVRVYYKGIVHGIFLRQFFKENADKRNLKGFVRNLEDGRVEAFLQGEKEMVDEMIEVCRIGPRHSQTKSVDVKEEKWQDDFTEFKVLSF
ncbi:acylphosphatase [Candidatus Pacearchaeota archaeon]|nr:acylphosphatase [Candidatus Pacearchaeota archaeon]